MLSRKSVSFFLLVYAAIGISYVQACVCNGDTPAEVLARSDAAFIGTVISSRENVVTDEIDEARSLQRGDIIQVSIVRVSEAFLGTQKNSKIEIETVLSDKGGIKLVVGQQYLIYASKNESTGTLQTECCDATSLADAPRSALAYLRSNKANGYLPSVAGFVAYSPSGNEISEKSKILKDNFAALRVRGVSTVELANDRTRLRSIIKRDGSFRFSNVPKGQYQLSVVLPESLTESVCFQRDPAGRPVTVDFDHGGVFENFTIVENGRISGHVTDADGKPVAGINVSIEPVKRQIRNDFDRNAGFCDWERSYTATTGADGTYVLRGVPTGDYLVGVRIRKLVQADSVEAGYPQTYFPDAKTSRSAKIVKVRSGRATSKINIRLAPHFKTTLIRGHVTWDSGRSADRTLIEYVARTPDGKRTGLRDIYTDENGDFSFYGFENTSYLINAEGKGLRKSKWIIVQREVPANLDVGVLMFELKEDGNACPECKNLSTYDVSRQVSDRKP